MDSRAAEIILQCCVVTIVTILLCAVLPKSAFSGSVYKGKGVHISNTVTPDAKAGRSAQNMSDRGLSMRSDGASVHSNTRSGNKKMVIIKKPDEMIIKEPPKGKVK